MELGALVCVAGTPRCGACPVRDRCAWRLAGSPAARRAAAAGAEVRRHRPAGARAAARRPAGRARPGGRRRAGRRLGRRRPALAAAWTPCSPTAWSSRPTTASSASRTEMLIRSTDRSGSHSRSTVRTPMIRSPDHRRGTTKGPPPSRWKRPLSSCGVTRPRRRPGLPRRPPSAPERATGGVSGRSIGLASPRKVNFCARTLGVVDVHHDDLTRGQLAVEDLLATARPRSRAGWSGAAAGHPAPGRSRGAPAASSPPG